MSTPIADDPFSSNPFWAIETSLQELDAAARLLAHMKGTPLQIGAAELGAIQEMIEKAHHDIEHRWEDAYEQQRADAVAHEMALAAAKAEKAAPGSVDDVKKAQAMWNVIRALANTALEACDKAEVGE